VRRGKRTFYKKCSVINNLVNDLTGTELSALAKKPTMYEESQLAHVERESLIIQTGLSSIQNVIITNLTTNKENPRVKLITFYCGVG